VLYPAPNLGLLPTSDHHSATLKFLAPLLAGNGFGDPTPTRLCVALFRSLRRPKVVWAFALTIIVATMDVTQAVPDDANVPPDVTGVLCGEDLERLAVSFPPFETQMAEETRARLLKDKLKVDAMARTTEALRRALHAQVAQRRLANEELQKQCDAALLRAREEFEALVEENTVRVEERLDALDERITALDNHFAAEKERINREIEEEHQRLTLMLKHFEVEFEKEKASRAEREAAIIAEMKIHEGEVAEHFVKESTVRVATIKRLQETLKHSIASRQVSDKNFEAYTKRQLKGVTEVLENVCVVRENEDDEIENALSRYTNQLQSSLHIINSKDE